MSDSAEKQTPKLPAEPQTPEPEKLERCFECGHPVRLHDQDGGCAVDLCDCVNSRLMRLVSAPEPAAPVSSSPAICSCGTVMVCPDIGCDHNKLPVSSSARPARTLKDYRPQHDENCDRRRCAVCGGLWPRQVSHADCRCVGVLYLKLKPCSCGLDALLSGGAK